MIFAERLPKALIHRNVFYQLVELAVEREDDEVLEGMGLSAQSEIRAIEAALERVASGDYGYCTKCGTKIAEDRLDVVPYTPFCRNCAH